MPQDSGNHSLIRLEGLSFRAFHGVYPKEREQGNDFEVDVVLEVETHIAAKSDSLGDTIDYAAVCSLVNRTMEERCDLLETLAHRIADRLTENFLAIHSIQVKVAKLNPPLGTPCRRTSVEVRKSRA